MLRDYQRHAIDRVHALRREGHKAVLIVSPTGSGKTMLAAEGLMLPHVLHGGNALFVVHLREVVDATVRRLRALHIPTDVLMPGRPRVRGAAVTVASIATITARGELPAADLVVIDEAHRAKGAMYEALVKRYPRALLIGLTATPVRTDGQPLTPPFTGLVVATDPTTLVKSGHLVPVEAYGGEVPDLDNVPINRFTKDFDAEALGARYATQLLLGDAVQAWKTHAAGLRTVAFASSRAHAQAVTAAYIAAGVRAAYVDGQTGYKERSATLERLRHHQLDVVVNCDVYTEGWDEPLLGAVQLLRATKSLTRFLQMAGRGLRPITGETVAWCREHRVAVPKKNAVVLLDHGENLQRHGDPLLKRHWSLEGRDSAATERAEAAAGALFWQCKACNRIGSRAEAPANCPSCNEPLRRGAVTVPGELKRIVSKLAASEFVVVRPRAG